MMLRKVSAQWLVVVCILVHTERFMSKSITKSSLRHLVTHKNHRLDFGDNEDSEFDPEDERKALQHSIAVTEKASCELPKVHLIHVNDHYPDPNKFFLPHCTLLHRCGRHTGCCGTEKLRCVASEKEKVKLYFYTVRILGDGVPTERKIEALTFTNHTKCACVLKDNIKIDL